MALGGESANGIMLNGGVAGLDVNGHLEGTVSIGLVLRGSRVSC